MSFRDWFEERLLDLVRARTIDSILRLNRNRLPLGETDTADHGDDELFVIDPGDPEAQPTS